nr:hypothetical protein [Candidatus Sigynarchaeum springense]
MASSRGSSSTNASGYVAAASSTARSAAPTRARARSILSLASRAAAAPPSDTKSHSVVAFPCPCFGSCVPTPPGASPGSPPLGRTTLPASMLSSTAFASASRASRRLAWSPIVNPGKQSPNPSTCLANAGAPGALASRAPSMRSKISKHDLTLASIVPGSAADSRDACSDIASRVAR